MIQQKLSPGSLDVSAKFHNLAIVAEEQGDYMGAEAYEQQALAIRERLNARMAIGSSFGGLAHYALDRGDFTKAEDLFRKALAIYEELAPDSEEVTDALNAIGNIARHRGDLAEAEKRYSQSLEIEEKVAPGGINAADNLNDLGTVARARSNYDKAEVLYPRALAILEKLAPGTQSHANVLNNLGLLMRDEGHLEAAEQYFARSISALEQHTAQLGGSQDTESVFRAHQSHFYKDYISILLALKRFDQAFLVAEQSRSRSLLTVLASRDLAIDADLPADVRRALKTNANEYDQAQQQLATLSPAKDAARVEQLTTRLHELSVQRQQLIESVRRTSPRFATFQYPQPLDLATTRAALDPGTAMLSFLV
jgi:tetratricopeptide (TPR) repeat protein